MKRSAQARMLVATGVVLAFALIVYGAWRVTSADQRKTAAPAGPAVAAVQTVVTRRAVTRGQMLTADDVMLKAAPGEAPAGALSAVDQAVGKTAAVDIPQDQAVLASSLTGGPGGTALAPLVPAGMRAVSMDVTTEIAVANFVRPGDHVDVEIFLPKSVISPSGQGADTSEARGLLRNVLVLAVGGATSPQPAADAKNPEERAEARDNKTVTVAMTPEQVSQFVLARGLGRFYLTLRNPMDQEPGAPTRAGLASIRGGGMGGPVVARTSVRRAAAPSREPIEVVVDGRREVIFPGAGQ